MPFINTRNIRYFTFESFSRCQVPHAIFTRHGGVSSDPWKSLNVGNTVGDDPEAVAENLKRSFKAVNRSLYSLANSWLTHSDNILCVEQPRQQGHIPPKADAMITNHHEVTLFLRFADCVPIFLYDPVNLAIGVVHAGWKGTILKIAKKAIEKMTSIFGTEPGDVVAGVGPAIGPCHYEIGPDVVNMVRENFLQEEIDQILNTDGKIRLDLWNANRLILKQAGVTRIEVAGICTACVPEDWFSHRSENGRTGRFGALIGLPVP